MGSSSVVDAMTMFFAVSSLLALLAGILFIISWFIPTLQSQIVRNLGGAERPIALLCAGGAMTGSLYFSEVADFIVCQNCWYQRIAMYPIAIIMAVAVIRRENSVWYYIPPLATAGLLVSWYHIALQNTDWFGDGTCSAEASCSVKWVDHFGFVSIPVMAMGCFIFLIGLSGVMIQQLRRGEATHG